MSGDDFNRPSWTGAQAGSVLGALSDMLDSLGKAERRVANFIVSHPSDAVEMSVSVLAGACGCSESTVVRMCQHAGFKGYYQLRLLVAREVGGDDARNTSSAMHADSAIKRAIIADARALSVLMDEHNVRGIEEVVECLRDARKVIVCAAGNTLPIALDMSFRLNRFNIESYASAVFENTVNYISNSGSSDVLVAISKSGANTFVYEEVSFARKVGMKVVAITGDKASRIARASDTVLLSGRPEEGLVSVQKGLQSHVSDLCLVDAIMYGLIDVSGVSSFDSSEAAEFELAGWKE